MRRGGYWISEPQVSTILACYLSEAGGSRVRRWRLWACWPPPPGQLGGPLPLPTLPSRAGLPCPHSLPLPSWPRCAHMASSPSSSPWLSLALCVSPPSVCLHHSSVSVCRAGLPMLPPLWRAPSQSHLPDSHSASLVPSPASNQPLHLCRFPVLVAVLQSLSASPITSVRLSALALYVCLS